MARKLFLIFFVVAATFCAKSVYGQNNVAFVNTKDLINSLPEKESATDRLTTLSDNYKEELQIMQNEYNKKYSDFITYQESLAESIKLRRMQELTDLENQIQNFTKLAQKDIEEHEQLLLDPIKSKINDAIKAVGIEHNFSVIYDLDNPSILFVSQGAIDANQLVKAKLGIR